MTVIPPPTPLHNQSSLTTNPCSLEEVVDYLLDLRFPELRVNLGDPGSLVGHHRVSSIVVQHHVVSGLHHRLALAWGMQH